MGIEDDVKHKMWHNQIKLFSTAMEQLNISTTDDSEEVIILEDTSKPLAVANATDERAHEHANEVNEFSIRNRTLQMQIRAFMQCSNIDESAVVS